MGFDIVRSLFYFHGFGNIIACSKTISERVLGNTLCEFNVRNCLSPEMTIDCTTRKYKLFSNESFLSLPVLISL